MFMSYECIHHQLRHGNRKLFINHYVCEHLLVFPELFSVQHYFSLMNWLDVVGRSLSVATSTMLSYLPSRLVASMTFPYFGLSHDKAGHVFENFELTFQ